MTYNDLADYTWTLAALQVITYDTPRTYWASTIGVMHNYLSILKRLNLINTYGVSSSIMDSYLYTYQIQEY